MTATFRRRMWSGTVALATLLTTLVAASAPAHAYSTNPTVAWVTQNAGNCYEIVYDAPQDYFTATYDGSSDCVIGDNWTWYKFPPDQGGQNALIDVGFGWPGYDEPRASFYFEAYGEHLKVKDLDPDDHDSVYIWINGTSYCACLNTDIDLNLAEGSVWSIKITDDSAGTDVIACTNSCTRLLPHLYA